MSDEVIKALTKYEAMGLEGNTLDKPLSKVAAGEERSQPLYKTIYDPTAGTLQPKRAMGQRLRSFLMGHLYLLGMLAAVRAIFDVGLLKMTG